MEGLPMMTGAHLLIQLLLRHQVDTIFGYPGGAVLPVYDALYDCDRIRHILVRHEQAAVHAADGYARVTGRPGVALVTSGPGATNAVTGIATAYMDSVPLIVLTGQVPTDMLGLDSFQEVDIYGMTMPITKHNFIVMNLSELPRIVGEAFHIAQTGRPGPVVIDLPKNVMTAKIPADQTPQGTAPIRLRGYKPYNILPESSLELAAERLATAKRPVLLVGGGAMAGDAPSLLRELATEYCLPVASTLMGLGAFPSGHPLHLGMVGMHGSVAANRAVQGADVLLCLGVRFSDRVTGQRRSFSPHSYKIQVDIDEAELNKNIAIDLALCGTVENALTGLMGRISARDHSSWHNQIAAWPKHTFVFRQKGNLLLTPQEVIRYIDKATRGDAIITTDVGQHQIWTAHHYEFTEPRSFLTSGGLGTMGYGFPAAIGAAIACPNRQVVCVSGDGSFQMNMQELMTAIDYGVNVKVAILKNGYLGMVRQWQQLFQNKRYSAVRISSPDFASLANAFGARGFRARTPGEALSIINTAFEIDGPVIMEFDVTEEENVYPMVPPGASNMNMIEG
jgi:acetolactate synthase-1/2/3 large subunit